jgi:DNA-binding transcriptional LysR family regulator/tetratricopeptide (TPR) repeat protein
MNRSAMDPSRLLVTLWNWLPVFHAVAETEHLPTASRRVHVTPSALSRTIRSIEAELGRPLFSRTRRTMRLNADGRRLLGSVVRAMHELTAGLDLLNASGPAGPVFVSASGALAQALVVPALRELQERTPSLLPHVYSYDPAEIPDLLRSGQIDVSFSSTPAQGPGLESSLLGQASAGVYCGRQHPLWSADEAEAEVLCHGFVAVCSPRTNEPDDGFPAHLRRQVELSVGQPEAALQLCLAGRLLAVLPDLGAESARAEGRIRRLASPVIPKLELYATVLARTQAQPRARAVVEAVRCGLAHLVEPAAQAKADVRPPSTPPSAGDDRWLALGDALFVRGEHGAARRAYEGARSRREGPLSPLDEARYAERMARVALRAGQYGEAERQCVEVLRRPGSAAGVPAALLEVTVSMARCFHGDPSGAEEWLDLAATHLGAEEHWSTQPGGPATRALWYRAHGNLLLETARPHEAVAAFERGRALCAATGDGWEHSIALFNLGDAWSAAGELDRAQKLLESAREQKTAIGDRWGNAYVSEALGALLLRRQRPDDAARELTRGLAAALELDDPKLSSTLHATLGVAHFALDDLDAAQRAFQLALRDAERCSARTEEVRASLGLCAVGLRLEKPALSERAARRAHERAVEHGAVDLIAMTLFALAEVAMAALRRDDGAELYRAAFRTLTAQRPAFSPFEPGAATGAWLAGAVAEPEDPRTGPRAPGPRRATRGDGARR